MAGGFPCDLYGVLFMLAITLAQVTIAASQSFERAWYEMNDSSVSQIGVPEPEPAGVYFIYQKRVVRVEKKFCLKNTNSSKQTRLL